MARRRKKAEALAPCSPPPPLDAQGSHAKFAPLFRRNGRLLIIVTEAILFLNTLKGIWARRGTHARRVGS